MIDDSFVPTDDEIPTIESVLVIPHTGRHYHYWLNGSEDRHRANREKLLEYLVKLAPGLSPTLTQTMMDYHASFFLITGAEPQFIQMRPPKDTETSRDRIQAQMRNFIRNPHRVQREKATDTQEAYVAMSKGWLKEHRLAVSRVTLNKTTALNPDMPKWGDSKSL